jgi:hypothetical protein
MVLSTHGRQVLDDVHSSLPPRIRLGSYALLGTTGSAHVLSLGTANALKSAEP